MEKFFVEGKLALLRNRRPGNVPGKTAFASVLACEIGGALLAANTDCSSRVQQ